MTHSLLNTAPVVQSAFLKSLRKVSSVSVLIALATFAAPNIGLLSSDAQAASLDLSSKIFTDYDSLISEWQAAKTALSASQADNQSQIKLNTKVEQEVAKQLGAIDDTKTQLGAAVLSVAEAKRKLASIDLNEPDTLGQTLTASLDATKSKLNGFIQASETAQNDIKSLSDEQVRIKSTVVELKKAVSAAQAAASASEVVVEAVKSAQLAIAKSENASDDTSASGYANLETDFFNEAVQQAQAAKKSAEVAGKALTLTERRYEILTTELNKRKADLQASKTSEVGSYEAFANADRALREHSAALEAAKTQKEAQISEISSALSAAQNQLELRKTALQQETLALQELNAILDAGRDQTDTLQKRVASAKTTFNDAETALRSAQRERAIETAGYMADLNADLNQRLRAAFDRDATSTSARFALPAKQLFDDRGVDLTKTEAMKSLGIIVDQITKDIPSEVDWMVRVDAYTTKANTTRRAGWDMSTERALTIATYLGRNSPIPSARISANGFTKSDDQIPSTGLSADGLNGWVEVVLTTR